MLDRSRYHFVLAAEDPDSAVVYGCGINGELTVFKAGANSLDLLDNMVASDLMQSRAMLWYNHHLVVRARASSAASSVHMLWQAAHGDLVSLGAIRTWMLRQGDVCACRFQTETSCSTSHSKTAL